jgi:hypothetical protein
MTSIAQVAACLTDVLETVPNRLARQTGCIKRQGKFTGASLVSTLVLGLLHNPDATLEELTHAAAATGVMVSAQAIEQRFTPELAATLREVLGAAVGHVVTSDPVAIPLLARFTGVYLQDCSTISLPTALAAQWPGCGGQGAAGQAALKLGARLDLLAGRLEGPYLASGRTHDRTVPGASTAVPAGSLWMGDLGLVTLARLEGLAAAGGYWLTRIKAQTHIETADGHVWEQACLLAHQETDRVELAVWLGKRARIPARLLAIRVPDAVAEQRRERLRAAAARKRPRHPEPVSAERVALAAWNIYVTNVPAAMLTLAEAFVLVRARWQIELLFKLWKSHAHIDTSRSQQPQRIHCEVLAKLIGVVMQHWVVLTGAWQDPARSLVKLAQVVRSHVLGIATSLGTPAQLLRVLTTLQRCLRSGTQINRRKQQPNTYQLLLDPSLGGLA